MASTIKPWHIFAAILLLFILFATPVGATINNALFGKSASTIPGGGQTPSNLVDVNKPLQIAVEDPLNGIAISGATVKIIQGTTTMETLTTSSTGIATSSLPYKSGTNLVLEVIATNYVTRFVPVTVPQMSPSDAQALTTNFVSLRDVKLGTPSIQVMYNGVNYAGTTLNFTTLGVTSVTLTVSIYNTLPNSGWISSYDPVNQQNLNLVAQLYTTGSSVALTGLSSVLRGTSTYYLQKVNDGYSNGQVVAGGFSSQSIGGATTGGVFTYTFTIAKGSLAHGQTQAFTLQLYQSADPNLFAQTGTYGPDAAALGSAITVTFAA